MIGGRSLIHNNHNKPHDTMKQPTTHDTMSAEELAEWLELEDTTPTGLYYYLLAGPKSQLLELFNRLNMSDREAFTYWLQENDPEKLGYLCRQFM